MKMITFHMKITPLSLLHYSFADTDIWGTTRIP